MQTPHDRTVAELMEQLIETGPEGMAVAFTAMLNLAAHTTVIRPLVP